LSLARWVRLVRHLPELHQQFIEHRRWLNRIIQADDVQMPVADWRKGAELLARGQGLLNVIDGDPR
jgi:hypothetical protein